MGSDVEDALGGWYPTYYLNEKYPYQSEPTVDTPDEASDSIDYDVESVMDDWSDTIWDIFEAEQAMSPEMMELQWQLQNEYAPKFLEQQYQLQTKYAPLLLEQQYQLEQEYGLKKLQDYYNANMKYMPLFAELEKATNESLYPHTAGLQELLAGQAEKGMTEEVPAWARERYKSDMASLIGTNVGSPIGADYMSTGFLQQQKSWSDYFRDLALTVTGRLPLTTAQQVQTPQVSVPQVSTPQINGTLGWTQGFSPMAYGNMMSDVYGSQANAYASMYGSYANLMGSNYATSSSNTTASRDLATDLITQISGSISSGI